MDIFETMIAGFAIMITWALEAIGQGPEEEESTVENSAEEPERTIDFAQLFNDTEEEKE